MAMSDLDEVLHRLRINSDHDAADQIEQLQQRNDELTATVERLREALIYYADELIYSSGDVPGHIYILSDEGQTARKTLSATPQDNLNHVKRVVYADGYYDGFTDCRRYDFNSDAECEDMALHNADDKANTKYPSEKDGEQ